MTLPFILIPRYIYSGLYTWDDLENKNYDFYIYETLQGMIKVENVCL